MKKRRSRIYYPPPFTPSHRDRAGALVEVLYVARQATDMAEVVVYRDAKGETWVLDCASFYGTPSRRGRFTMLPMARRRGVADRTVRRWAAEQSAIPESLWPELRGDLEAHRRRIDALIKRLS